MEPLVAGPAARWSSQAPTPVGPPPFLTCPLWPGPGHLARCPIRSAHSEKRYSDSGFMAPVLLLPSAFFVLCSS